MVALFALWAFGAAFLNVPMLAHSHFFATGAKKNPLGVRQLFILGIGVDTHTIVFGLVLSF
jgi:hypothetical protein